jgi:hypothetical protein
MPTDVKIESPLQDSIGAVTHLSGAYELDQFAMPPPPTPTSLWPTAHDNTGNQMTIYSTLRTTHIDGCAYGAWGDKAFDFQSYDLYSLESQHEDPFHAEHHYAGVSPRVGGATNIDFMSLSASS